MKSLKKYIIVLSILSLIIALFIFFFFSNAMTIESFLNMLLWCIMYTGVLGLGNAFLAEYLNNKFDWYYRTKLRIFMGVIFTIFYSVFGSFIIMYIMLVLFGNLQFSDLLGVRALTSYTNTTILSIIISMFFHLRGFLIDWKTKIRQVEQLKQKQIEAKLEGLQKQMDAHFLFNSLSVLREIIEEDKYLAGKFVESFADVYRYIVDFGTSKTVTLKQEINFIKEYVYLHEVRFENALIVNLDINNCDKTKHILPLALQTVVENALKHNVFSEQSPLIIDIQCSVDSIRVKNNVHLKMNVQGSGIGLKNLNDRLQLIGSRSLKIEITDDFYEIEIPLL